MGASVGIFGTNLKPCFAEILRTCVKPPTLVVRVEHVFGKARPRSRRNTADDRLLKNDLKEQDAHTSHISEKPAHSDTVRDCLRLAVSDGQLQIQAVLARHLHKKELLELQKGDLVEVSSFQIRSAPRLHGEGRVVFLGVDACEWAGRDQVDEPEPELEGGFIREETEEDTVEMDPTTRKPFTRGGLAPPSFTKTSRDMHGAHKRHCDPSCEEDSPPKKRQMQQPAMAMRKSTRDGRRSQIYEDDPDATDEDSFETISVSQSQVEKRREALKHINRNIRPPRMPALSKPDCYSEVKSDVGAAPGQPPPLLSAANESNLSRNHTKVDELDIPSSFRPSPNVDGKPPTGTTSQPSSVRAPVHTLFSLLDTGSSLPRRSYTCTILAVVSWVSPSVIHKPNTPFPPKRHIKIHDQTISHRQSGVTVAVFVDAKEFMPKVGTVALLRGVVMQRFGDEVILNRYGTPAHLNESDLGERSSEQDWFVTDSKRLMEMGFDVSSVRTWWEERERSRRKEL